MASEILRELTLGGRNGIKTQGVPGEEGTSFFLGPEAKAFLVELDEYCLND
jgi:hypothetical protein